MLEFVPYPGLSKVRNLMARIELIRSLASSSKRSGVCLIQGKMRETRYLERREFLLPPQVFPFVLD